MDVPKKNEAADRQRFSNLVRHCAQMADLLASPWVVSGPQLRSWHTRYIDDPGYRLSALYDVALIQRRGVDGFSVSRVSDGSVESLNSGIAVSLFTAAVWLGLDQIAHALTWDHEL